MPRKRAGASSINLGNGKWESFSMSEMSLLLAPGMETSTATPIESSAFVSATFLNYYKYDIRILELVGRNQYKSKRSDAEMQNESVRYKLGKEKK